MKFFLIALLFLAQQGRALAWIHVDSIAFIGASNDVSSTYQEYYVKNSAGKMVRLQGVRSHYHDFMTTCTNFKNNKNSFLEAKVGYSPTPMRTELLPKLLKRVKAAGLKAPELLVINPSGNAISYSTTNDTFNPGFDLALKSLIIAAKAAGVKKVAVLEVGPRYPARRKSVNTFNQRLNAGTLKSSPYINKVLVNSYALETSPGSGACSSKYCDSTSHWRTLGDYRVFQAYISQLLTPPSLMPRSELANSAADFNDWVEDRPEGGCHIHI